MVVSFERTKPKKICSAVCLSVCKGIINSTTSITINSIMIMIILKTQFSRTKAKGENDTGRTRTYAG
jgi:hypothetical protein